MPLMAPAILLAGIGPLIAWRKGDLAQLLRRMRWLAVVALLGALFVPLAFGRWGALTSVGLLLAFWIVAGALAALIIRIKSKAKITRAFVGMLLAHAGIGVFVIGVTLVKSYESERDLRMAPGDTATLGGYSFRFDGVREVSGPNYAAARGAVRVQRDGETIANLAPEKRVYLVQRNPMTEAAISASIARDIYVSLGEAVDGDAWTVRIHVKPFIRWIWFGCLMMAFGGLLAASDRRYRVAVYRREDAAITDATVIRSSAA
jgi:cytochrome c-type biogenesis protein CcmF